jgi:hypothetical protein
MPINVFTTLDDPLAVTGSSEQGTTSSGINAAGQIVGTFDDTATPPRPPRFPP